MTAVSHASCPGSHKGVATAMKTARPAAQAAALPAIQRHARGTWCRSSIHCADPIEPSSRTAASTPAAIHAGSGQSCHAGQADGSKPTHQAKAAATDVSSTHRREASADKRVRRSRTWNQPRTAPSAKPASTRSNGTPSGQALAPMYSARTGARKPRLSPRVTHPIQRARKAVRGSAVARTFPLSSTGVPPGSPPPDWRTRQCHASAKSPAAAGWTRDGCRGMGDQWLCRGGHAAADTGVSGWPASVLQ